MTKGQRGRGWRLAIVAAMGGAFGGVACGGDASGPPVVVSHERRARPNTLRAPLMRTLSPDPAADPAPFTGLALAPATSVAARVLVITANGQDAAFSAITRTLDFLGTPYTVLNATTGPSLTEAFLNDGDRGNYQAVFLDLGDLSVGAQSAFSDAEWMALASYEARFGIRRVALYASPSAAYGLALDGGDINPSAQPVTARCTAAGSQLFKGANCTMPVTIDAGWVYPARAVDAQTTPLLLDDAGRVLAATHAYPDGREALALTFAQSPGTIFTLQLAYGLVSWATRGLFLGERHVYLSAQIDDFFLASRIYPGTGVTYRMTDADLQTLADWQASRRANPLFAGLRLAWAFNAQGSRGVSMDPLTAKAVALNSAFSWISHTWDHADLTSMPYDDALLEFTRNDRAARDLGLAPYSTENLVTPGITGLDNPDAMRAAFAAGIRHLVSDTSIPAQDNPSANAGYYNALVPGILSIPRLPTELDYDVSQPAEWIHEYNDIFGTSFGYQEILTRESQTLVRYLLAGDKDPWMFHQANGRDFGAGHSLLGDLLGATLDRYQAAVTFPIESPTMDQLAHVFEDRMAYDASEVSATIEHATQLTVRVVNAARIPVTGLCTPAAERYGDQTISYLDLGAGRSATFSLSDCNAGPGTGGSGGGPGGAGGATGTGGAIGPAGAGGTSGTAGAGGVTGTAGTSGATGAGGATGTAGTGGVAGVAGATGTAGTGGAAGAAGTSGLAGTGGATATGGAGSSAGSAGGITGAGGGAGAGALAGTNGAGGTAGAAGTTPTGGTTGGGGAYGRGGAYGGSGGQPSGRDGAPATTDATSSVDGGGDGPGPAGAGCDCGVGGDSPTTPLPAGLVVLIALIGRRRRRGDRSSPARRR